MTIARIGSEFVVNNITFNDQFQSAVTALADGRFVVTWTDASQSGGDASSYGVRGRIFNADGSQSVSEFLVNTTITSFQYESAVTALADGRFLVTWTDASASGGDTSLYAVRGRIFNADGSQSVPEFLVNTTTASYQNGSAVTALADGRFLVTWSDLSESGGDTSSYAVRGRIFNPDGSQSVPEFLVNTATTSNQYESPVTALADGRFLVTWSDFSQSGGDTSDYAVRGRIFNPDGSQSVPEFLVNTTTANTQYESAATALADGRFLVTWTDESASGGDTSSLAVRGRIFNPDGTQSVPEFLVNTATTGNQHQSAVTALADGRFLVTWTDNSGSGGDTSSFAVRGRIFNPDGTEAIPEFLVNTTTYGNQSGSAVTALADGRFVVTWTDNSGSGGDTSSLAVRAQIFDPTRYDGTGGADTVRGGSFDDSYYGYAGDDVMHGAAGDDYLNGGEGSDTLHGDAGNDRLVGGASADFLYGGDGNDVLRGGAAIDVLDGGAGLDTAVYGTSYLSATITRNFDGTIRLSTPTEGVDTLLNIEQLQFTNGTVAAWRFSQPTTPALSDFGPGAGGWSDDNLYPRHMADLNGDGFADIVGFGGTGVWASLGNGSGGFSAPTQVSTLFAPTTGWTNDNTYHREVRDMNNDGRADLIGFGQAGVLIAYANGSGGFGAATLAVQNFGVAQGWASQDGYARAVADVNGDGYGDVVGFGFAGTWVSLGGASGTFSAPQLALSSFGSAQGWTSDDRYHRTLADVNGDGRADIIGFGQSGTWVALANTQNGFSTPFLSTSNFGVTDGWSSNDRYSRYVADVNGDHLADLVGFGQSGTWVALATGGGNFAAATFETNNFGIAQGWSSDTTFHRELADLNGDQRTDIIGFGYYGVYASTSATTWQL